MSVLTPTLVGTTAIPYRGKLPCGFMRKVHHRCKDAACPLNHSFVMVFEENVAKAIDSCHRLWEEKDLPLITRRLRVNALTYRLSREDLEYGLVEGDPAAWADLRAIIGEHDRPPVHLSTVGALISFGGSPGSMWLPEGSPVLIPPRAEPDIARREHPSWWDANLESPDDLID